MKILLAIAAAALLCGCAYPQSTIEQGAELGHMQFFGPPGADVRVDGEARGTIGETGTLTIDVSPGRRHAEEAAAGQTLAAGDYEVGLGSTVKIGGGR